MTNSPLPEAEAAVEARELLACPFCGGAAQTCPDDSHGAAIVFCPDRNECPAHPLVEVILEQETLAEAIAAWNTRPADPGGGDVALARQLVCEQMHDHDKGPGSFCEFVEAGLRDDCPEMRIALAALAHPAPVAIREQTLREAAAVAFRTAGGERASEAILALIASPIVAVPREATKVMLDAGEKASRLFDFSMIWRAMYDAALSPDPASDEGGE